jgi:ATP-dependent RNA helicase DDX23/PRP28
MKPVFIPRKKRNAAADTAPDVAPTKTAQTAQTAQTDKPAQPRRRNVFGERPGPTKKVKSSDSDLPAHEHRPNTYLTKRAPKTQSEKDKNRKNRFVFDWDASEDTSLGRTERVDDKALLFGRGGRAGIRNEFGDGRIEHKGHWTQKSREEMTERDWRIFREDFSISFKGMPPGKSMLPILNWSDCVIHPDVMRGLRDAKYAKPSPIQMASIPIGLKQRDVIGIAETGSGKTAAFVVPMLQYIKKQPVMRGNPDVEAEGPYAVILAPTRELAQQIESETNKLARHMGYRVVCIVGGKNIEEQGFALRQGCEILVATPGRLLDCIKRRYAVLNQCNYVVLDEADRMIDMGFEADVTGILDAMPSSNLKPSDENVDIEEDKLYRTTYMFSATMPPAVERLAKQYLRRPVTVNIGSAGQATDNVTQRVMVVKESEKKYLLRQELEFAGDTKAIIFVNSHKKCEDVLHQLQDLGYRVCMIHGRKSQDEREASIAGFRSGKFDILVATDVAGRGLDIADVTLVVNFDMPSTVEAYTHRIGRTGRAGKKGNSVTFLTNQDSEIFHEFCKFLERGRHVSIPIELKRARPPPKAGPGERQIIH